MKISLVSITKSTKKEKKLQATFLIDGKEKIIHFGSSGNKDFTIYSAEGDKKKAEQMRNAYIARHSKNENWNDPLTAGSLSRFVLWEAPTISGGISAYKKRFGF